jgi:acetyltransferase
MNTKETLIYRQVFTLRDGTRVLLRPLTVDDRQVLLDLFNSVSPEDLRTMRHNVSDSNVVESWIDELDYDKVFPLVAVVNDLVGKQHRIVGIATLHFKQGPYRHRAELRIFLSKDYRRRGVGSHLIEGLIDLAKRRGIFSIEVEIVSDQTPIIRAFHSVGFETKSIFEDYFMLPDGELRDVAHLVLRLRTSEDKF